MFLILPGLIEEIADLLSEPTPPSELLGTIFTAAERNANVPLDAKGVERIGIVSHHLFSPKQTQGVFLPLANISEKTIVKAYRDLLRQKRPDELDVEGVIKELQSFQQ